MTKRILQGVAFLVAAAALCLVISPIGSAFAGGDPDISTTESECQGATAKITTKLFSVTQRCVGKCEQDLRKNLIIGGRAGCAHGVALADSPNVKLKVCISQGQEKALDDLTNKCKKDCPECYSGGDCDANASSLAVATVDDFIPSFLESIYCDDSTSADGVTAREAKCFDNTGRNVADLYEQVTSCYSKCIRTERKGFGSESCQDPIGPAGDPVLNAALHECIDAFVEKAVAKIDGACSAQRGGETPECYGATTGSSWTSQVLDLVGEHNDVVYCGE